MIHITHAISDAKPEFDINYDLDSYDKIYHAKLKIAMSEMGASVAKGSFTTFLGAVALIFSQSQAFRIFFYMFTGIIIIAVAHGMLLTPALMGEMRFVYSGIDGHIIDDDHNTSNKRTSNNGVTLNNLTLAQSVGNSNVSDFANREDYATVKPSMKAKKELTPIMAHGTQLNGNNPDNNGHGIGIVDNVGQRTPIDDEKKRKSIQMANYNSNDSNYSDDPFEE